MTQPIEHTLCGALSIVAKFNGEPVPEANGDPLTYVSSTKRFTVFTNNDDYILQILPYSLTATFVNYPPD